MQAVVSPLLAALGDGHAFLRRRLSESKPALSLADLPAVSASHVLFLVAMLVFILPLSFALDPLAAGMRGHWPDMLRRLALASTGFAKAQWVLVPAGLVFVGTWLAHRLLFWPRPWEPGRSIRIAAYLFATTGSAELLSGFLKGLFGRPRPFMAESHGTFALNPISFEASLLSFPSGHATAIAASCMAVALLWARSRPFMLLLALWLGFTRIVTGAHYPSDVAVGLVLGAYLAMLMSLLFERSGLLSFSRS